MTNKKLGNKFENELAETLYEEYGYWVHLLNQNKSGQPADIIAVKNKRSHLIDAKVCSKNNFRLNRIEENQHMAMKEWQERGNGVGWFALKVDSGIYMMPYTTLMFLGNQKKVIPYTDIITYGYKLESWVRIVNYERLDRNKG